MSEEQEISVPIWWKNGGMIYRRDCLPIEHPECTYNYIKNQLKKKPEDYGVFHPDIKSLDSIKTLEEAKGLILQLKKEVSSLQKDLNSICFHLC